MYGLNHEISLLWLNTDAAASYSAINFVDFMILWPLSYLKHKIILE
jgi:hypothetical protein